MMIAAPGVTKAHPVSCSDALGRRRAAGTGPGRRPPGSVERLRRSRTEGAATSAVRTSQSLIDLLGRAAERGLRLALAQQDRHDHGAEDLGDLRVAGGLRPRLADV